MIKLKFEVTDEDMKSKKYWLSIYKCKKNDNLIQDKTKELHKELMDYIWSL